MKFLLNRLGWMFLVTWLALVIVVNLQIDAVEQQYTFLARSITVGRLDINNYPYMKQDGVLSQGNYYWPLGVFPAIVLAPFVGITIAGKVQFLESYLQPFLVVAVGFLVYKLARKLGYEKEDSKWWLIAFCGGSMFSAVALLGRSWEFAQVVTVILLWWTLAEYLGRKNYWLIGLLMGLVWLSRITAGLGILFFAWEIVRSKNKWKNLVQLAVPFGICVLVGLGYNFLRFGSWWETGYAMQILPDILDKARSYGLFSLRHVPGNIYHFLIAGPIPVYADSMTRVMASPYFKADPWGMSILWTSPYILKILTIKKWEGWAIRMLIVSGIIAGVIFLYYGVGVTQIGYRYALDFWPFLQVALMSQLKEKRLSPGYKWMIFGSGLLNLYWFINIFVY